MRRILAATLSVVLLSTNVLWAHKPETTFWAERQQTLASLPANFQPVLAPSEQLKNLPKINRPTPSLHSPLIASLPLAYGSVRKINKVAGARTIIHIQDVHLNPEAQGNISKAVQELINQKKIDLVALEGAFGPIDFSFYRDYPYPASVKATADYLFKEKKISGAVYAAYISKENLPPVIGVDQRTPYNANVEAYKQAVPLVKKQKERLVDLELKLGREKAAAFNKELMALDARVQAYRQGKTPWGEHIRFLAKQTDETSSDVDVFLAALDQESQLDFARVEAERTQLLEKLVSKLTEKQSSDLLNHSVAYKMGTLSHADFYQYIRDLCGKNRINLGRYPAMDDYIRYVLLSEAITIENVLRDAAKMEEDVYGARAKTAEEKELVLRGKQLYLTGKLINFSLTHEEWKEYHAGNDELKPFEDFYRQAEIRDAAMSANLLKAMDKTNAKVAVLVTGGFHSNGINERMKEKGITTIAYVPKITKIEEESGSSYLSVFTQEKTPLDRLFAGEKLFVSPLVNPQTGVQPVVVGHTMATELTANFQELKDAATEIPADATASRELERGQAIINTRHARLQTTVDPATGEIVEASAKQTGVPPIVKTIIVLAGTAALWYSGMLSAGGSVVAAVVGVAGEILIRGNETVYYVSGAEAIQAAIAAKQAVASATLVLDAQSKELFRSSRINMNGFDANQITKAITDAFAAADKNKTFAAPLLACRVSFATQDGILYVHITFDPSFTPWRGRGSTLKTIANKIAHVLVASAIVLSVGSVAAQAPAGKPTVTQAAVAPSNGVSVVTNSTPWILTLLGLAIMVIFIVPLLYQSKPLTEQDRDDYLKEFEQAIVRCETKLASLAEDYQLTSFGFHRDRINMNQLRDRIQKMEADLTPAQAEQFAALAARESLVEADIRHKIDAQRIAAKAALGPSAVFGPPLSDSPSESATPPSSFSMTRRVAYNLLKKLSIGPKNSLVREISKEYKRSGAQNKTVAQMIDNIRSRQGNPSFDVANAIRVQPNPDSSPELAKMFAIGLELTIKNFPGAVSANLNLALNELVKEGSNFVILVKINRSDNLMEVEKAIAVAREYNKKSNNLAVVAVVITDGGIAGQVARAGVLELMDKNRSAAIAVAQERDLISKDGQIAYKDLFREFSWKFHGWGPYTLFTQLANDDVTNKKVVVIGTSQTPYIASENLLSVMRSLVPVVGGYLMINLNAVLEAARNA